MSDKFFIELISGVSKYASQSDGLIQKLWYYLKKKIILKSSKCLVIEPYAIEHINDDRFVHLEKIYLNTLNNEQKEIITNLYEQNEDVYLLFSQQNIKKLFTALRWLNKNKPYYIICSSVELSHLLHIKKENIFIVKSSDQLFNTELQLHENQELLKRIHNKLTSNIIYYNYEELNDIIKRIN